MFIALVTDILYKQGRMIYLNEIGSITGLRELCHHSLLHQI